MNDRQQRTVSRSTLIPHTDAPPPPLETLISEKVSDPAARTGTRLRSMCGNRCCREEAVEHTRLARSALSTIPT